MYLSAVEEKMVRSVLAEEFILQEFTRFVGTCLNRCGVRPMPLKGALLQKIVYGPGTRSSVDLDLLVHPRDVPKVRYALMRAGFTRESHYQVTEEYIHKRFPIPLDLHWAVFPEGLFNLSTDSLFMRSSANHTLFGFDACIPQALDLFAHLIGHFVKSRMSTPHLKHLNDFVHVAKALHLDAFKTASHLEECGLHRAARYTLQLVYDFAKDTFALDVLRYLRFDPLGALFAASARRCFAAVGPRSKLGVLPTHLLNHGLAQAMTSLFDHASQSFVRANTRNA